MSPFSRKKVYGGEKYNLSMIKKEIQLHIDSHVYGNQLGMVYTAFREVNIDKPTSLQEF
jgi:hypothetical protein